MDLVELKARIRQGDNWHTDLQERLRVPRVALPEEQCYTRQRQRVQVRCHDQHVSRRREEELCQAHWRA